MSNRLILLFSLKDGTFKNGTTELELLSSCFSTLVDSITNGSFLLGVYRVSKFLFFPKVLFPN